MKPGEDPGFDLENTFPRRGDSISSRGSTCRAHGLQQPAAASERLKGATEAFRGRSLSWVFQVKVLARVWDTILLAWRRNCSTKDDASFYISRSSLKVEAIQFAQLLRNYTLFRIPKEASLTTSVHVNGTEPIKHFVWNELRSKGNVDRSRAIDSAIRIGIAANDARIYLCGSSPTPYLETRVRTLFPSEEEKEKQRVELFRNEKNLMSSSEQSKRSDDILLMSRLPRMLGKVMELWCFADRRRIFILLKF